MFGECLVSAFYVWYVLYTILLHLSLLFVVLFGWSPGEHVSSLLICVYVIEIHGMVYEAVLHTHIIPSQTIDKPDL